MTIGIQINTLFLLVFIWLMFIYIVVIIKMYYFWILKKKSNSTEIYFIYCELLYTYYMVNYILITFPHTWIDKRCELTNNW